MVVDSFQWICETVIIFGVSYAEIGGIRSMSQSTVTRSSPSTKATFITLSIVFILSLTLGVGAPLTAYGANIKEGDLAPDFAATDMDGVARTLQAHLGKDVVMLDFWSIYCVSCIQEMPHLVELYEKYKDKGFVTYGIDLDSFSPKRVERFIKGLQFEITYPVIIDRKREIAGAYKIGMLPTTILIGRDGKIKMFHIGYKPGDEDEFDHLIEKLVN
jgi:peroxiredoxin